MTAAETEWIEVAHRSSERSHAPFSKIEGRGGAGEFTQIRCGMWYQSDKLVPAGPEAVRCITCQELVEQDAEALSLMRLQAAETAVTEVVKAVREIIADVEGTRIYTINGVPVLNKRKLLERLGRLERSEDE